MGIWGGLAAIVEDDNRRWAYFPRTDELVELPASEPRDLDGATVVHRRRGGRFVCVSPAGTERIEALRLGYEAARDVLCGISPDRTGWARRPSSGRSARITALPDVQFIWSAQEGCWFRTSPQLGGQVFWLGLDGRIEALDDPNPMDGALRRGPEVFVMTEAGPVQLLTALALGLDPDADVGGQRVGDVVAVWEFSPSGRARLMSFTSAGGGDQGVVRVWDDGDQAPGAVASAPSELLLLVPRGPVVEELTLVDLVSGRTSALSPSDGAAWTSGFALQSSFGNPFRFAEGAGTRLVLFGTGEDDLLRARVVTPRAGGRGSSDGTGRGRGHPLGDRWSLGEGLARLSAMMHSDPSMGRATYQDVLDAPEDMTAELIDGALYLQPRPAARHVRTASRLGALLGPPFDLGRGGPGGWTLLYEPEVHIGEDVVVPDLAGWQTEAAEAVDWSLAFFEVVPQWVCEVLSPSTARLDRLIKLDLYLRAGVRWAWLVDPVERSVEVFRASEAGWVRVQTATGEETVALEPFEAVALELALAWAPSSP